MEVRMWEYTQETPHAKCNIDIKVLLIHGQLGQISWKFGQKYFNAEYVIVGGHKNSITWQLCAQKFLMICCSFNWLSGIRFYQECKKLKCWLLTYWDHICIISFGIIDCCKHENNRPNIGAVSNVWLRRSEETYKTWYPIILRQTCSSLARQCKIGG